MPPPALPYRVGHGFDLHRLEEGPYKLILGGLEIPHDRGCVAHSDGESCWVWQSSLSQASFSSQLKWCVVCVFAGDALLHTVTGSDDAAVVGGHCT